MRCSLAEGNNVFDDGFIVAVKITEDFCRIILLVQNPLPDDFCNIRTGQGNSSVEASLDLGEIISHGLGDGINILLAGDGDPHLTLAGSAQIFGDSLQIHHQFAVISDILADLINQEYNMVVFALFAAVLTYIICKLVNGKAVGALRICRPVSCCLFAHNAKRRNGFNDFVLNEIVVFSRFFPGASIDLKEFILELLILAGLIQLPLKICQERNRTTIAKVFIENLHEDILDSLFIRLGIRGTLGVHIEEDHIRILAEGSHLTDLVLQLFIRHFYTIQEEAAGGVFCSVLRIYNYLVRKNIGKYFQKMRFTTSKETGDPDTHLVCPASQTPLVRIEEPIHIFVQFFRHNVLIQLLIDIFLILLSYLDDTIDLTVNALIKHVSDFHGLSSCLTE